MTNLKKRDYLIAYTALIYGFYLFFNLVSNLMGRTEEHWRFIYAFTQQSNLIASLWLILLGLSTFANWSTVYKMMTHKVVLTAITVYLSITFFIVLFVLDPVYLGEWLPFDGNFEFLFHNATTLIVWLYFFLIPGHGKLEIKDTVKVLIYPFIYVLVNLLLGYSVTYLNGEPAFAYGFINPNTYGGNWLIFLIVVLALIVIFSSFSIGLILFKKRINQLYFDEE